MKLYVVGLGPGEEKQMTLWARQVLGECDLLVGYCGYIDLIRKDYPDKRILSTPMTGEVERCRMALAEAAAGSTVGMVCSGDAGVYGMAGLILELAGEFPCVQVQIIPGVTAAMSGAAVLGAPLTHDFAVVSLSDLLTPWQDIAARLDAAARADFVLCLYNPASKKRTRHLKNACDILLQYRSPDTVCGLVRNIGREGQQAEILTLAALREKTADMFTTVFIGSSKTRRIGQKMVTPRGYAT
jgi:precorrin-3B C17-methyltransferase